LADKVEGDDGIEVSQSVAELMEMEAQERVEYCKQVIKTVGDGFKEIAKIDKRIAQARALKSYMEELKENMEDIRTAILYTIKPQFRDVYLDLLEELGSLGL